MKKARHKLSHKDQAKIQARFELKFGEYVRLPLYDKVEEFDGVATVTVRGLQTIFTEDKLSSTDKRALLYAMNHLLRNPKIDERGVDRIEKLKELAESKEVKNEELNEEN